MKLYITTPVDVENTLAPVLQRWLFGKCNVMLKLAYIGCFTSVHVAASECLQELTKLYNDLLEVPISEVPFKSELLHQWEIEKNEQAKSLMKKCIDMICWDFII
ncbi:hypothetical protein Tco_1024524 [Tanacetum coccineum]